MRTRWENAPSILLSSYQILHNLRCYRLAPKFFNFHCKDFSATSKRVPAHIIWLLLQSFCFLFISGCHVVHMNVLLSDLPTVLSCWTSLRGDYPFPSVSTVARGHFFWKLSSVRYLRTEVVVPSDKYWNECQSLQAEAVEASAANPELCRL